MKPREFWILHQGRILPIGVQRGEPEGIQKSGADFLGQTWLHVIEKQAADNLAEALEKDFKKLLKDDFLDLMGSYFKRTHKALKEYKGES